MMIEEQVYQKLLDTSTVTDLVGSRILPIRQRVALNTLEEDDYPVLFYSVNSAEGYHCLDGPSDTRSYTIEFEVYGLELPDVKDCQSALLVALDGWRELPVQGLIFESVEDLELDQGFGVSMRFNAYATA